MQEKGQEGNEPKGQICPLCGSHIEAGGLCQNCKCFADIPGLIAIREIEGIDVFVFESRWEMAVLFQESTYPQPFIVVFAGSLSIENVISKTLNALHEAGKPIVKGAE